MLKKPIVNTVVQIIGKVVTVLISLITTGVLTRKLGVGVYGSFTLVSSIFILLDSLSDFGTKVIGVKEASLKEDDGKNNIFIQVAWLRLLLTSVAFFLGLILIFNWSAFALIRLESVVALSMIWFTSLAGSLEIIFQTKMRMDLKVLVDVLFPLLFLVVLFTWDKPITLLFVFSTYLLARILSLFVGFGLVKKVFKTFKISSINWKFLLSFLKESWPMGVYLIIFTGYDRAVDSMLIQKFIGIKEVAFYGLSYKIYSSLVQPAYFFINSVFPIMALETTDKRKLFKLSALLMGGGLLILIPIVYFMSPFIINVLAGNGFEPSIGVLRALLIALFFSYIGHLIGFTLIANGGQKEILKFGLVSLTFNVLANIFAIPRYGIMGAALVTGATEALNCIFMGFALNKRVR
ncbi:MAG: oligosaccharide flippase family protein [Candidatus Shapirobacteria bacterium]